MDLNFANLKLQMKKKKETSQTPTWTQLSRIQCLLQTESRFTI